MCKTCAKLQLSFKWGWTPNSWNVTECPDFVTQISVVIHKLMHQAMPPMTMIWVQGYCGYAVGICTHSLNTMLLEKSPYTTPRRIYVGVSLNGDTPKTFQNDSFLVGKRPMGQLGKPTPPFEEPSRHVVIPLVFLFCRNTWHFLETIPNNDSTETFFTNVLSVGVQEFQVVVGVVFRVFFCLQQTMFLFAGETHQWFWSNYSDLTRPHPR